MAENGMLMFHEVEEILLLWKIEQTPALTEFRRHFNNWDELMEEYFVYFHAYKDDPKYTIRLRNGIWQDADGVTGEARARIVLYVMIIENTVDGCEAK